MKLWIKGPDLEKNCCSCEDRNGSPCNACGKCPKINTLNSGRYSGDVHYNLPAINPTINLVSIKETGNIKETLKDFFISGLLYSCVTDRNYVKTPESIGSYNECYFYIDKPNGEYFNGTFNINTLTIKHQGVELKGFASKFFGENFNSSETDVEKQWNNWPFTSYVNKENIIVELPNNLDNEIIHPYYTLATVKIKDKDIITFSSKFYNVFDYNNQDNSNQSIFKKNIYQPLIQPAIFDSLKSLVYDSGKNNLYNITFTQKTSDYKLPFVYEQIFYKYDMNQDSKLVFNMETLLFDVNENRRYISSTPEKYVYATNPKVWEMGFYTTATEMGISPIPPYGTTTYEYINFARKIYTLLSYSLYPKTGCNLFKESIYPLLIDNLYFFNSYSAPGIKPFNFYIEDLEYNNQYNSYWQIKPSDRIYKNGDEQQWWPYWKQFDNLTIYTGMNSSFFQRNSKTTAIYNNAPTDIKFKFSDIIEVTTIINTNFRKYKGGVAYRNERGNWVEDFGFSHYNAYAEYNYSQKQNYNNTQITHTVEASLSYKDNKNTGKLDDATYCVPIIFCGPESSISISDKYGNPVDIKSRLHKLK